jgi:hypothetical protein
MSALIFQYTLPQVLSGKKTQTRRVVKPGEQWDEQEQSVRYASGRLRWKPGVERKALPGRDKPASARIKITAIRKEVLGSITEEDAQAEGFESVEDFKQTWEEAIHGSWNPGLEVWVITFVLIEVSGRTAIMSIWEKLKKRKPYLVVITIAGITCIGLLLSIFFGLSSLTSEQIVLVFGLFLLSVSIITAFISKLGGDSWWAEIAQGISTEMIAAIITGILFVFVLSAVEDRQAEEQWKKQLILQMGSPDNAFAVEAARTLLSEGWLEDGSLKEAYLIEANLQGADLIKANLQEAALLKANLQGAILAQTNLEGADLRWGNLEGAYLGDANLEGAYLRDANLEGANLENANLQGAYLFGANLEEAYLLNTNIQGARFSQETILPDGSEWTPETDMSKFTNLDHPDFWAPERIFAPIG